MESIVADTAPLITPLNLLEPKNLQRPRNCYCQGDRSLTENKQEFRANEAEAAA